MIAVTVIGNLGGDPETKSSRAGNSFTTFSLAHTRKDRDGQKSTTWVRCTLFGARGEAFARFHRKGDRACVVGEAYLDEWQDRDGGTRTDLKVEANSWDFVKDSDNEDQGRRGGNERGGNDRPRTNTKSRDTGRKPAPQAAPDDDIPF